MKLGILTAPFPDRSLADVADWAASAGFEALEIACWPAAGAEKRRYAGTAHLPVEDMTPARGSEIMGMLADKGLTVSGLGYYPNPLHADAGPPRQRDRASEKGHHGGGHDAGRRGQHLRRR